MSASATPAANLLKALRTQGPAWALTRVRLRLARDLGLLERKTPVRPWSDFRLRAILRSHVPSEPARYMQWRREHAPKFFWKRISTEEGRRFIGEQSIQAAERVLQGEFPFFAGWRLLGFPPAWSADRPDRVIAREPSHWSRVDEFGSGDIKLAWEANRFAWAFLLARAFLRSGDVRYGEAFWRLLEYWIEKNPPNVGVNWKCGQECSFRLMALCFAFHAFAACAATTPDRVALFAGVVAAHARRIDAYIEYAISQHNNHAISEGTALWTAGMLFPEFEGASHWRAHGKSVVEKETERQVYDDGAYIQHSANYHRVLLHDLAWAIRLGELNADPFPAQVYEKFRLATRFLHSITDADSGMTPNYGHNDGARVLPLNDCAYSDMRPLLQCCHYLTEKKLLYPAGPWDEESAWLHGVDSLASAREGVAHAPADLDAASGGCYTIRRAQSWMMLRATRYRDRPAHADQLHCDLWWRGRNILCDGGTFSYNGEPPFTDCFSSTRHHNTVLVDGQEQMTRISRFLWADWANASAERKAGRVSGSSVLEAAHDGYHRLGVAHRRAIAAVSEGVWIIVDDLTGSGAHEFTLHWLLPDVLFKTELDGLELDIANGPVRIQLYCSAEATTDVVRAGRQIVPESEASPDPTRGWVSRSYARKDPALSLAFHATASTPVRFVTVVTLGRPPEVAVSPSHREISLGGSRIALAEIGSTPIFNLVNS